MNRIFAIPILFFLIFFIGIYFLLPKYQGFLELKDEISEKELQLQQRKNYFSKLKQFSAKLEEYQESINKISSALPGEFSLASLLNFFQRKSSESGLVLKSLSQASAPQKPKEKKEEERVRSRIKTNYLNFTLRGSLSSFENFLSDIEKSARLIEVENISLQAKGEELPEFTLLLKIYSY